MELKLLTAFVALLAILAGTIHRFYVKPILEVLDFGRVVESVGNRDCIKVPEIQACEKIVLHQATGTLYLACSEPSSRRQWLPAGQRLNLTGRSGNDFVATYDFETSRVTRLEITHFRSSRGLSLHGMDVVPSSIDPRKLYIYLVNHRVPVGQDPRVVGADSVIEIFETKVGSGKMKHLWTVEDPVIIAPNDVVGLADGRSFYFTNDHGKKIGFARTFMEYIRPASSVGYCQVGSGCKFAITNMCSNNGIVRAHNDTFYVASTLHPRLNVLEKGNDGSLLLTDFIPLDRGLDNLSIDDDNAVWAVGFPKMIAMMQHMEDINILSPSCALKFTANTGPSSFYGEKYKIEKVFEDNGTIASGSTTVVHDARRNLLYLHGLAAQWLTVCRT